MPFGTMQELGNRHRPGIAIALQQMRAMTAQIIFLLQGFHAFGHHGQAQLGSQLQDAVQDIGRQAVTADAGHKTAVDFQFVHIQLLQIGQAGMPGAKIVDGNTHAQIMQFL